MSTKKNKGKHARKNTVSVLLWVVVILFALVTVMLVAGLRRTDEVPETVQQTETTEPLPTESEMTTAPTEIVVEVAEEYKMKNLHDGLIVTDIGKYTGIYMEDGSDELVTGVLMLVVKNTVANTLQYAEIRVPTAGGEAIFKVSTLPAGESVVLLEQNRMLWNAAEAYDQMSADNVAFFSEEPTLLDEKLKFQIMDGALNVTNVSGEDITGDIVIYYKNAAADLYYGGITYRLRIEGGMKVGELKQIMGDHLSGTGTRIMFATVG